ncbi:hypothetical protein DXG01_016782 [Tephrocybe rancida]|nr:hypothetical protein DXG01_016782 [Tephrocybe rancida]
MTIDLSLLYLMMEAPPPDPDCYLWRLTSGLYDTFINKLKSAGNFIGTINPGRDLYPVFGDDNKFITWYSTVTRHKAKLLLFGQISTAASGLLISAKGNHKPWPNADFTGIDNDSKPRMMPILTCPKSASSAMRKAYRSQLVAVDEILETNEAVNGTLNVKVNKWLHNPSKDGSKKDIACTLPAIYATKPPRVTGTATRRNRHMDNSDSEGEDGNGEGHEDEDIFVGALLDPNCLPDNRGPYFRHQQAKLVQHDIRDKKNKLIPSWKIYEGLAHGTLVVLECTLHCWMFNPAVKTYQLSAHSVCVIDSSDEAPNIPSIHKLSGPRLQISQAGPSTMLDPFTIGIKRDCEKSHSDSPHLTSVSSSTLLSRSVSDNTGGVKKRKKGQKKDDLEKKTEGDKSMGTS